MSAPPPPSQRRRSPVPRRCRLASACPWRGTLRRRGGAALDDPVLAAVVLALAGARRGDPVATVGTGPLTTASLLAASSTDRVVATDARVVVAGAAYDVPAAVALLAPGGRLVGVAADAVAAQRLTASHGLVLRHVVPVDGRLAWSATLAPPP